MNVHLLFGFLGAGKTTLVRRLIDQPIDARKTAVIVNEFGEVGVDGQILSGNSVDIIEFTSGCLCCTLRGALSMALEELRDMQQVERVIVEATGVAQPAEMLESLADDRGGLELEVGRLVTVVDTAKLPKLLPMLGEFYANQIVNTDVVVLNKCDLVTPEELERARGRVLELNASAEIVFAEQGEVDNMQLLKGCTARVRAPDPHHSHHVHEPPAESFVLTPHRYASRRDLQAFFGALSDEVWRAKGYVELNGECHLVQYAMGQLEIIPAVRRAAGSDYMVFIGRGMDRNAIEQRFELVGAPA